MSDNDIIKDIEDETGGKVRIDITFIWKEFNTKESLEYRYMFTEVDLELFDLKNLATIFSMSLSDALKKYKGG